MKTIQTKLTKRNIRAIKMAMLVKYGSQAEFTKFAGIHSSTPSKWFEKKLIPVRYSNLIAKLTDDEIILRD